MKLIDDVVIWSGRTDLPSGAASTFVRCARKLEELEAQLDDALGAVDSLMMQVEEPEDQLAALQKENSEWKGRVKRLNQIIADDSEQMERSKVILKGIRKDRKHLREQLEAVRGLPEKWRNRLETHYLGEDDFLHGRKDANHTCANELEAIVGDNDDKE